MHRNTYEQLLELQTELIEAESKLLKAIQKFDKILNQEIARLIN